MSCYRVAYAREWIQSNQSINVEYLGHFLQSYIETMLAWTHFHFSHKENVTLLVTKLNKAIINIRFRPRPNTAT